MLHRVIVKSERHQKGVSESLGGDLKEVLPYRSWIICCGYNQCGH